MKLCIVTHAVVQGDGQGRVNYEIVQEVLRRKGHTLTLLASQVAPGLETLEDVDWIPIAPASLPSALLKEMAFSRQSARWLRQHRHEYDVVLSNGAITSAPSHLNAVHFVHSTWLHSPHHTRRHRRDLYGLYQWLYTALNAHWEQQALQQARCIAAVSQQVKTELLGLGLPEDRIQVMLNGVDLNDFQPAKVNRADLDLPARVPLALFIGDIRTPRKNLETVLHALVQVPNLHLAIAGDTSGSPYPALAKQLGVQDRTHFLGYRRDIPQLMQAADLFVFPSRYETFGLVVLEAMASGLPVITAPTTGAAELITPEAGYVVSHPDNVAEVQQALTQLTHNPQLRQRMGTAARRIAQHHTWQAMAQQYVDLLETLAEAESTSAAQPLPS